VYHLTIFDAFYFISYTATTIGFGETPFVFTYPQRIWVSMSIFFTVTGWFYSVGTLIALLQNKLFLEEFEKAKFTRKVAYLKEKYIIILGYNSITSEIIKKANEYGLRSVVIEKRGAKERSSAFGKILHRQFFASMPMRTTQKHLSAQGLSRLIAARL